MRAGKSKHGISPLVVKHHFASMPLFREEPLINWTYTKTVLFTAYDICRSHDFWLDKAINSGRTLKECLVEIGFPKRNTILADTGIFEIEARKAGLAKELGIPPPDMTLSNQQIVEAYKMSGADYFVSPDEIVLATDSVEEARHKLATIKQNFLEVLDLFPASQVVGVLQGVTLARTSTLFDFYRSHGVKVFALGGIIPLYYHDKELFEKVIAETRELTKGYWLHCFGLPRVSLLSFYLHKHNVNSVDTSMLLYMSGRRKYLNGVIAKPVRLADFSKCDCVGCRNMGQLRSKANSLEFFVNLYLHNILEAKKVSLSSSYGTRKKEQHEKRGGPHQPRLRTDGKKPKESQDNACWTTAYVLLERAGQSIPDSKAERKP